MNVSIRLHVNSHNYNTFESIKAISYAMQGVTMDTGGADLKVNGVMRGMHR